MEGGLRFGDADADIPGHEFFMQRVHIVADDIKRAADHAVAGMRGKVEDRSVPRDPHIAWIALRLARRDLELDSKAEQPAVELARPHPRWRCAGLEWIV